jgi:hypothetical protein
VKGTAFTEIEDRHLRVGDRGSGDRDHLPLALAEVGATFGEHRVVSLGENND